MKFRLLIFLTMLLSLPLSAQDSQPEKKPDKATQRENPASPIPYEAGEESTNSCEDRWSNFLPIWGKEACIRT
jgi:hypothetical protein